MRSEMSAAGRVQRGSHGLCQEIPWLSMTRSGCRVAKELRCLGLGLASLSSLVSFRCVECVVATLYTHFQPPLSYSNSQAKGGAFLYILMVLSRCEVDICLTGVNRISAQPNGSSITTAAPDLTQSAHILSSLLHKACQIEDCAQPCPETLRDSQAGCVELDTWTVFTATSKFQELPLAVLQYVGLPMTV
jgi:hypothetical protein